MSEPQVIIAGAGPVGLVTALGLAQRGIQGFSFREEFD